jgi:hypothetical protein
MLTDKQTETACKNAITNIYTARLMMLAVCRGRTCQECPFYVERNYEHGEQCILTSIERTIRSSGNLSIMLSEMTRKPKKSKRITKG